MSWEQISDKKKLANKIVKHQNPHVVFKTRFMFGIMRMMQKKGCFIKDYLLEESESIENNSREYIKLFF